MQKWVQLLACTGGKLSKGRRTDGGHTHGDRKKEEHTEEHSDGHTWTSGSNTHTPPLQIHFLCILPSSTGTLLTIVSLRESKSLMGS